MRFFDTLIVGGGFGGASCAAALERLLRDRGERTVLVAPDNFLLFSPLLPEAASGTIEPRHAVIPLRSMLPRTRVLVGEVVALDPVARVATVRDANGEEQQLGYRSAVLSPGSVPATLPIPGLAEQAVGFKTLADAIWLRNRLLRQLDAADAAQDPGLRRELLTFTVVGGGYAGVEALAELESFGRAAVANYPGLGTEAFRWVLVEAQPTLLPGLHPRLAQHSAANLRRRGVDVHTGTRLRSVVDGLVELDGVAVAPYRTGTLVWTAGQRPSPLAASAGLPVDARGRVVVDDHLRVGGHADLYALGDGAAVPSPEGGTAPMTAQHALREGRTAARNVAAGFGVGSPAPFRYRSRGLAVTLGEWQGAAQVRGLTFTGPLAWWMGRSYHLLMMPGLGRKARVVADWTMALFFPRDLAQLGQLGTPTPLDPPP